MMLSKAPVAGRVSRTPLSGVFSALFGHRKVSPKQEKRKIPPFLHLQKQGGVAPPSLFLSPYRKRLNRKNHFTSQQPEGKGQTLTHTHVFVRSYKYLGNWEQFWLVQPKDWDSGCLDSVLGLQLIHLMILGKLLCSLMLVKHFKILRWKAIEKGNISLLLYCGCWVIVIVCL